ncbi:MAG: hypothetical protein JST84_15285 [Acidobacteria bacterium]|nr:hypothetical protein [Acidobacteriota bacterium]
MPLLFGILSQTPPKCIGSTPATADKVGRTRAATDSARDCAHGFTVTGERIRTMPMTKRSVSFA